MTFSRVLGAFFLVWVLGMTLLVVGVGLTTSRTRPRHRRPPDR